MAGSVLSPVQIGTYALAAGLPASALPTAIAIALRESSGNPAAIHHNTDAHRSTDWGLWQINTYWHPEYSGPDLLNPATNARAMVKISKAGSDWSAWSTYGAHLARLPEATLAARQAVASSSSSSAATGGDGGLIPGIPDPFDLLPGPDPADVIPNPVSGWVGELLSGARGLLLGLLLASAGAAIVFLGLQRLTQSSETLQGATQAVQSAAMLAAV